MRGGLRRLHGESLANTYVNQNAVSPRGAEIPCPVSIKINVER